MSEMKLKITINLSEEQHHELTIKAEVANRTVGQYIECLAKIASSQNMISLPSIGAVQRSKTLDDNTKPQP